MDARFCEMNLSNDSSITNFEEMNHRSPDTGRKATENEEIVINNDEITYAQSCTDDIYASDIGAHFNWENSIGINQPMTMSFADERTQTITEMVRKLPHFYQRPSPLRQNECRNPFGRYHMNRSPVVSMSYSEDDLVRHYEYLRMQPGHDFDKIVGRERSIDSDGDTKITLYYSVKDELWSLYDLIKSNSSQYKTLQLEEYLRHKLKHIFDNGAAFAELSPHFILVKRRNDEDGNDELINEIRNPFPDFIFEFSTIGGLYFERCAANTRDLNGYDGIEFGKLSERETQNRIELTSIFAIEEDNQRCDPWRGNLKDMSGSILCSDSCLSTELNRQ